MKRVLLGALIALSVASVHAKCTITSMGAGVLSEKLDEKGWNLPDGKYAAICAKLERANAKIAYKGQATVLSNTSIGSAVVMISDNRLPENRLAVGDYTRYSTYANSQQASMSVANDLAYDALMDAVAGWDIDNAIAALQDVRKKGR